MTILLHGLALFPNFAKKGQFIIKKRNNLEEFCIFLWLENNVQCQKREILLFLTVCSILMPTSES